MNLVEGMCSDEECYENLSPLTFLWSTLILGKHCLYGKEQDHKFRDILVIYFH